MRTLWKPLTVAVVVGFFIGAAVGTWHAGASFGDKFGAWGKTWGKSRQGTYAQKMVECLNRELRLTDDQRRHVEEVFTAGHEDMLALRAEVQPRFQQLRQKIRDEIRQVLTPEQQEQFTKFEARREARRRERMKRWRHGDESGKGAEPGRAVESSAPVTESP